MNKLQKIEILKYFLIFFVLIGLFVNNASAFEPSYTNYFSNSEFQIYKILEKSNEFSIPYKISDGTLDKITLDCESNALIANVANVGDNGNLVINIPRSLLDMKINENDEEFIVILDQFEVASQEIESELESRTLDISLRPQGKVLEVIATNVGMFPEPIPCGTGNANESPYYRHLTPISQIELGISNDKVQCRENLVLIQKYDRSPACIKPESINTLIERGWADKKFRTPPILDLQSPDRIFREVGYLELMMLLPHVEEDETMAISLEGRSSMVLQMIQRYEMDVLSNKTSADESFSSIFAKITKTNLQRFFEDEPMNFFTKHGMLFTSLRGYQDNTGTYGPFNQFLDDDESREIGDVLQYYENKRTNQEEVRWSDFVEWPTGIIKEDFIQILEKRKMQETCETFSGTWNKDFATCFDFSDQYDCEGMGGIYVDKAYAGQQPDYSKKSDSFVCEFKK